MKPMPSPYRQRFFPSESAPQPNPSPSRRAWQRRENPPRLTRCASRQSPGAPFLWLIRAMFLEVLTLCLDDGDRVSPQIETTFPLGQRQGKFSRGRTPVYGARRLGVGAAYGRSLGRAKIDEGDDAPLRGQAERSRNIVAIGGRARTPGGAKPKGVRREKNILGRAPPARICSISGTPECGTGTTGTTSKAGTLGFTAFAVAGFQAAYPACLHAAPSAIKSPSNSRSAPRQWAAPGFLSRQASFGRARRGPHARSLFFLL